MINQFETYGKIGIVKRTYYEIKSRFSKPKYDLGFQTYIPKLNKFRVVGGFIGVAICIVTPLITPLFIFPLRWGLK